MAKKYVVVEEDESYLLPLEMKLAEMVGENSDIEIITSSEYFDEFFSAPKTIDVLVIDEANYTPAISKHNIAMTFILTEDSDSVGYNETAEHILRIFKYMSIDPMMKTIIVSDGESGGHSKPKMISVISAEGGSGCTTAALGISACLCQSMKRVLYINTQEYQNFHYFLNSSKTLPMASCIKLSKSGSKIFSEISADIIKDGFSYIPPLPSAQYNQGIKKDAYAMLADAALQSNEYDFIIVDIGTEIQTSEAQIIQKSDSVIILARQTELSAFKFDVLSRNIDCTDKSKFTLVCNMYDSNEKNELIEKHTVDAYIEKRPEPLRSARQLLLVDGILQLAHSVM